MGNAYTASSHNVVLHDVDGLPGALAVVKVVRILVLGR